MEKKKEMRRKSTDTRQISLPHLSCNLSGSHTRLLEIKRPFTAYYRVNLQRRMVKGKV